MTNIWFNNVVNYLKAKGHKGHTAIPMLAPTGKSIRSGVCPKCSSKSGIVFQSTIDVNVFILACKPCNQFTLKTLETKKDASVVPTPGTCGCGEFLPKGRKKFCYSCRPASNKVPKEVVSQTSAVY